MANNGHTDTIEDVVLGSILIQPELIHQPRLRPEHFRSYRHQSVYATAQRIAREGRTPDVTAVLEDIIRHGDPTEHLGHDWQNWLLDIGQTATSIQPEFYIGQLVDAGERRRLKLDLEAIRTQLDDPTTTADRIRETVRQLAEQRLPDDVRPVRVGDLISAHPCLNDPVISGIVRRGEVMNIISKSKVGKSWFGYGIVFSVALGWKWFGHQCQAGKVLLIDNELHPSTLAYRLQEVGQALGLAPRDYADKIDVLSLRGRLVDIFALRKFLTANAGYSLILCDALYRMAPAGHDENANGGMTAIYNELDSYAALTNAAIVCIHHATKGSQAGKDVTDVGSGAGAQSRAADVHLVLRPHEEPDCVVMEAALRSFAPLEPQVLRWGFPLWTIADDLDPADVQMPKTRGDEKQSAKDRETSTAIVDALRTHGDCTVRQLRRHTGFSADRLSRMLATMVRDQRLSATEITVRGNVCDEYHLAEHLVNKRDVADDVVDHVTAHVAT